MTHHTVQRDSRVIIVSVVIHIPLPDNNRVISSTIRGPLGINIRIVVQLLSENKWIGTCGITTFSGRSSFIPTSKLITVARHWQCGFMRNVSGIHKVGRLIGSTPAVLVVDQPVAFGEVHREDHIARNDNSGVVRVVYGIKIMALDIASTGIDFPAFKVVEIVAGGVGGIHRIALLGVGVIEAEHHLVGTGHGIVLIQIRDGI